MALTAVAMAERMLNQRRQRLLTEDHFLVTVRGEILELKDTIMMVDQLSSSASEDHFVAKEVGTANSRAEVEGVAGTWRDLTESVNSMAGNLTNQVRKGDGDDQQAQGARRNSAGRSGERRRRRLEGPHGTPSILIAKNPDRPRSARRGHHRYKGDLSARSQFVDVRGEILERTPTMVVDQLNSFASEVTRVAREVGTDGKLGGQAQVKGVGGVWKDLTDSVNFMAGNLTAQVRNIAEERYRQR